MYFEIEGYNQKDIRNLQSIRDYVVFEQVSNCHTKYIIHMFTDDFMTAKCPKLTVSKCYTNVKNLEKAFGVFGIIRLYILQRKMKYNVRKTKTRMYIIKRSLQKYKG